MIFFGAKVTFFYFYYCPHPSPPHSLITANATTTSPPRGKLSLSITSTLPPIMQ